MLRCVLQVVTAVFLYYTFQRFCTRFFPVSKIFTATLTEIKKHSISILSPHFHGLDPKPIEVSIIIKGNLLLLAFF